MRLYSENNLDCDYLLSCVQRFDDIGYEFITHRTLINCIEHFKYLFPWGTDQHKKPLSIHTRDKKMRKT